MKLTKIFGIVLSLHVAVILLVMFQPGCQTVPKEQVEEDPTVEQESTDASFNTGVTTPVDTSDKEVVPPTPSFVSPTRPLSGDLIVPGQEDTDSPSLESPVSGIEETKDKINLRPSDLSIYKIQRGDTLWGIARKNGLSMNDLLGSNPNLDKSSKLSIGQEIMIPVGVPQASQAPVVNTSPSAAATGVGNTYIVSKGDSLSRIARNNRVSLSALMQANALTKDSIIRPGQTLQIPAVGVDPTPVSPAPIVPSGATSYEVKKGDNLTRIAAIHGTSVRQIMEWNNLADAGKIRVGQKLIVSKTTNESIPAEEIDSGSEQAPIVPVAPESEDSSVQDFFKGQVEERPIIDAPENP